MNDEIFKICVGPGIEPNEEKCTHGNWGDPLKGFHMVKNSKDAMPYNGIINWRCEICFKQHTEKVRERNKK